GPDAGDDRQRRIPDQPPALHLREHGSGGGEPRAGGIRRLLPVQCRDRGGRGGGLRGPRARCAGADASRVGSTLNALTTGLTPADLQISSRRRRRELAVRLTLLATAAVSVLVSAAIIASLIGHAFAFFVQVD